MSTGAKTKDNKTIMVGSAQIRIGSSVANISNNGRALDATNSIGSAVDAVFSANIEKYEMMGGFPQRKELILVTSETAMMTCNFREITPFNLALAKGLDPSADISAAANEGTIVSTAGTFNTGDIAVTDAGGVIDEKWTVVFSSATAGAIYGEVTGHVHDFVNLTSAMAPDNGGNPYFSIAADAFTGTWAQDDTFTFNTTPYVAGSSAYADSANGNINLGVSQAPASIRLEAYFVYPDGSRTLNVIFPKAQISSSLELAFNLEEAATPGIEIESLPADEEVVGGNAVWNTAPLGRLFIESV